jgi:glucokinase
VQVSGVPSSGPVPADANSPSASARLQAPKVVMGPGTGLGAAQLFWDSGKQDYVVVPGEGAHATFAPRGWRQQALAGWAAPKLGGMVEIEAVACGSGLELIYEFLLSDDDTYERPGDMPQQRRVSRRMHRFRIGCLFSSSSAPAGKSTRQRSPSQTTLPPIT